MSKIRIFTVTYFLNGPLGNYRDTPHPATRIPPASMIFRDGKKKQISKSEQWRIYDEGRAGDMCPEAGHCRSF